ncbi:MAG: sirohydrochlorin cobaltochelatase [Lachnospiraceae bacterium]|jgi:sirohydrochlorin cobaltochelatase|nr:sirohydrochlorin cobaltochelatase [Lachnospiraceae bacterium]
MLRYDTIILAVSTGTGRYEDCELTIGAVERAIQKAYPAYEVRRVFTGRMAIERLKENAGLKVENPGEALERTAKEGIKNLLVQPTCLLKGDQYTMLSDTLQRYAGRFEHTALGKPLLCEERDLEAVVGALTAAIEKKADVDEKTIVCLLGHGTKNGADSIYGRIREKLHSTGFTNYYVASLKDRYAKERIAAARRGKKSYKKAVLVPFMLVSGFHAAFDIAGEQEDSWKSVLQKAGYEVSCMLSGLGEIPAIQDIYVEHAKAAFSELTAREVGG